MSLKQYKEKRHFNKTNEPRPEATKSRTGHAVFVVQKHRARRLHYDFRLEISGVLKSWAIPKGPSVDPSQKRLAVMVEDHPYDYKDFEGVIPQGEYGAGPVMIWDEGTYTTQQDNPAEALENGALRLVLDGKKLKGRFTLVRTKMGGSDRNWLMGKARDDYADDHADILEDHPNSARPARSLEEIEAEG